MANTIEYANALTKALDLQLAQKATSGWMQENSGQIRFNGGKYIQIPRVTLTGLGTYGRSEGNYPKGVITTAYDSVEIRMDRAAQFYFDRNDVDESGYVMEAGAIMSQFQKEHVIPELDAYRYSTIAQTAITAGKTRTHTPKTDDILSNLIKDLRTVQDMTGYDLRDMVVSMPYTVFEILETSGELNRQFMTQNIEQGGVNLEVLSLNGAAIVPVPSARMKTKYVFAAGVSTYGFSPDETAKDINWIVTAKSLPMAVAKTDNLKIFSPEVNQDGDGWKTQYRVYHDVFIPSKLINGVFVNTK